MLAPLCRVMSGRRFRAWGGAAISAQRPIGGDLLLGEQRQGFQMRREMGEAEIPAGRFDAVERVAEHGFIDRPTPEARLQPLLLPDKLLAEPDGLPLHLLVDR